MDKTKKKETKKPKREENAPEVQEVKIADLVPDDKNFNRGTQYGQHLLEKSLRELGAGRSILIDRNNRIIAGNKTAENAAAIGLDNVLVVETDGSQLVAVKRTDIDLDSQLGRKMALADNSVGAVDLELDNDLIAEVAEEFDFDAEDWGITFEEEDEVDIGKLTEAASSKDSIKEYSEDTNYDLNNLYRSKPNPYFKERLKKAIADGRIRPQIADIIETRMSQCAIFNFDEIIKYYRSKDATSEEKELLKRLYLVFVAPKELFDSAILKYRETTQDIYDNELLTDNYDETD